MAIHEATQEILVATNHHCIAVTGFIDSVRRQQRRGPIHLYFILTDMKNKIKSNPAKTVLTISVGFIIVFLVTRLNWALTVSLVVGLIGVLSDYLSNKIDYLWMKLTWILSLIVPNILLGIVFFLFLFPVSLLSKLFGRKDPLHLKNKSDTVYVTIDRQFDKDSFENPW